MNNTETQLFKNMTDAIAAYQNHCDTANNGFHIDDEYYAAAKAAGQAYADYYGITYEHAIQIAMELF